MDLEHVPEELKIAFVRMLGDKSLSPKNRLFALQFINTGDHQDKVLGLLVNYQS